MVVIQLFALGNFNFPRRMKEDCGVTAEFSMVNPTIIKVAEGDVDKAIEWLHQNNYPHAKRADSTK